MAKHFERANIKRISIKCAWLLMFIDDEYNLLHLNSIRIIEGSDNRGSDNRGSDNRGSTVCIIRLFAYTG